MTAVLNTLFLKYWSLHTACLRDCMIEIPIIANPWVSDLRFKQEQSLEHSDGCMTSMLAIVVLGFHQDSIVCISSDERWWDTTRGTSGGKNNYWAYFPPKSFTHQQVQQKGLVPLHCYYEMKNGQQISTETGCLLYLPVICLLLDRSGHCAVWGGSRPLMISVSQPLLCVVDGCAVL